MTAWGRLYLLVIVCAGLSACATVPSGPDPQIERDAIAARMMADIEVLASNEFGGRKPGTPGGEKTVSYLIERMQAIGLESGTNDPGSAWRAPVELVGAKPLDHKVTVRTSMGARELPIESSAAYSLSSRVLVDGVEVVFVGSGSRALPISEITGRIVILARSGQDRRDQEREARELLFAANPAAVLTVVPDDFALSGVKARFENERLFLAGEVNNRLSAFVTRDAIANALPRGEWERLTAEASRPGFMFEVLKATIAIDVHSVRREFTSSNVIGLIPGQLRGSGAVLLMAHWDHLGECAPETPDPICNGAVDNASGLALMLELARRLKAGPPLDRDIYFLATSAEEAGLLGAKAFVEEPAIPLDSIVASFNFDTVAVAKAGEAFGFVGEGRTSLDSVVKDVVSERGGQLGNREFAATFLQRHDGWALLEEGVPSVLVSTAFSSEIVLGPYLAARYHKPGDKVPGIELGGAVDDLLLHEALVKRVGNTLTYPLAGLATDTSASQ